MTIATTHSRVDYVGNGATLVYSYTFKIFSSSDLLVTQRDTDDNETTLVLDTDYTVSGVGDSSGGSITLSAGNLPSGYALTIRRVRPLTQETDFRNQGDFFPETHEDEFDKQTMVNQQQQDEIDRSIQLPETVTGVSTELPVPVALKLLRWSAAATALELADAADFSTLMTTVGADLILAGGNLSLANPVRFGTASGVDTITTTTSPAPAALADNLKIILAAAGANTSTAPTFAPDGLTAKTIVKGSNQALVPGDIPGADFRAVLVYDASLDKWVLLNPKFPAVVEVQSGSLIYVADSGAADAYVATLVPAVTAYTTGMVVRVKITNANATTTPTLNVNSLGAKTIKREGGGALLVGDLPAGYMAVFQYDGTDMILLNPALVKNHTHAGNSQGGGPLSPTALTLAGSAWPSFSVHRNGTDQSLTAATWEKVQWTTEVFDTNNDFDSSTNYRFTPTVAGKYLLTAAWQLSAAAGTTGTTGIAIYKNGSLLCRRWHYSVAGYQDAPPISMVVDANGTTDYFEIYVYSTYAYSLEGTATESWFSGCRIG